MKLTIIFILFTIKFSAFGQINFGYNPELLTRRTFKIVEQLKDANQVESSYLYYEGITSKIYPITIKLLKKASNNDLIELTKHPNPVIRFIAFGGLIDEEIDSDILYKILLEHLKDTIIVKTQIGCIANEVMVGDYMLNSYKNSKYYKLSIEQLNEIDNLLFWNKENCISEKNKVFNRLLYTKKNYEQLKNIVVNEKNPYALLPLLRYKNSEDRKYIKDFIYISPIHAFEAYKYYPVKDDFEEFKKFQLNTNPVDFSTETWMTFYDAALQFPKDSILEIYYNVFYNQNDEKVKIEHADYIYRVIAEHKSPIFLPVKCLLLGYIKNVSIDYFNYLWDLNPDFTYEIIKKKFENDSHPFWDEDLIENIINKVEDLKGDSAIIFINEGIKNGYSTTFYTLAFRAKKYNNAETKQILINCFNNLDGNSEQDIYYKSTGILLYNNFEVYKGIEEKVYYFLNNYDIGESAGGYLIEFIYKVNLERSAQFLIELIKSKNKNDDLLLIAVNHLLRLINNEINIQLKDIYIQSNDEYKNSSFGKEFYIILKNHKLI